ncbi:hypothetical protein FKM82_001678 [Ascaphus truei]
MRSSIHLALCSIVSILCAISSKLFIYGYTQPHFTKHEHLRSRLKKVHVLFLCQSEVTLIIVFSIEDIQLIYAGKGLAVKKS